MKNLFKMLALLPLLSACNHDADTHFGADSENNKSTTKSESASPEDTQPAYQPGDEIPATAYIEHGEVYNPEAVIPPQCYTRTDGQNNPCYVCHQTYTDNRPNVMKDVYLQGLYDFSDAGMTNSWKNLFKDRSEEIKKISNKKIIDWVNTDNYFEWVERESKRTESAAPPMFVENLAAPDIAFNERGVANDNSHWVAFNYKPFPSAFWPTNGSTDDVMIRLPAGFREINGEYSEALYFANLSLLELSMKRLNKISIPPTDESKLGLDIDGDGKLSGSATSLMRHDTYLGDASDIPVYDMLYPEGTEFLHTVRYVGVNEDGEIFVPKRMKEVRYMKKHQLKSTVALRSAYFLEAKEKHLGNLPLTVYIGERGIDNRFGWTLNAYIEDQHGQLRRQNKQEMAFCNGCHKTVGSTIDQTFSFARKVDGTEGWGYINLKEMKDVPSINEEQGEYLTYFERVGGGDEFRQNREMQRKYFNNGKVDKDKVRAVDSIYELITPSRDRALALNKAYKRIVEEQSYIFGRDVVLSPANNVIENIDADIAPLENDFRYQYDIRLNWDNSNKKHQLAGNAKRDFSTAGY
jgi:hypothetical protein